MTSTSVKTLPARFASKLSQVGDCWQWTGGQSSGGYGHIGIGVGVCRLAHRVSWELHRGPIPEGLQIDHLCRNRLCVNPDHLEPVPPALNNARSFSLSALNAEKEWCVRGHLLDGANLRMERGKRVCRACKAIRQREARALTKGTGPGAGSFQAAKTACPSGHPYDDANTYVTKSGKRQCRTCSRAHSRRAKAARRSQARALATSGTETGQ